MSSLQSGDNAEPNLVPILDMVFQLITFFMLVMNFKAIGMDLNLKLPVVGSARAVEVKPEDAVSLVLNIDSQGALKVQGGVRENIGQFAEEEGRTARLAARRANPNFKDGDDLPMTIVIRADKDTTFDLVYRVVKAFQQQGFRAFHYMAEIPK
jgi:biopolymer transport protein ExbD